MNPIPLLCFFPLLITINPRTGGSKQARKGAAVTQLLPLWALRVRADTYSLARGDGGGAMMQCFFVSSSNMHVESHCWPGQPRQRMALQLFLCKPCHDTFSAYWSVLTMSVELKERHAWVHTDFPQKMWNMLLFGGKITFSFFFKYYSTYSIYIYIKTHYPHLTTRQAHPEWICRSPLSLSTPIPLFL